MLVLDASIAASWAFEDERDDVAARVMQRVRAGVACAPSVWWFEIRNSLLMGERRGRIPRPMVVAFLRELAQLPIDLDHAPVETVLLDLARRHRLTVYDAAYLELATRLGAPLATLDRALADAAAAAGVDVLS
jgi:predicted nucleic acid-binding protein